MSFKIEPCSTCTYIEKHGEKAYEEQCEKNIQKILSPYPEKVILRDLISSLDVIDVERDECLVMALYKNMDTDLERVCSRGWIKNEWSYGKHWISPRKTSFDIPRYGDFLTAINVISETPIKKVEIFVAEQKVRESDSNRIDIDIPTYCIPNFRVHLEIEFEEDTNEFDIDIEWNAVATYGPRMALARKQIITDYGTFQKGYFVPREIE